MATIKSFSDLQQSKKLAEILPLESADMHYVLIDTYKDKYSAGLGKYIGILPHHPAWSLAALLELLPKRIEIVDNVYELSVYLYGIYYYNVNNGNLCFESENKDNFVDACYEMIVRLNELKML